MEKASSSVENVNYVVCRIVDACRVSESTVKRCQREIIKDEKDTDYGRTGQGKPKITVNESSTGCIRRIVRSFYSNGDHPTLGN